MQQSKVWLRAQIARIHTRQSFNTFTINSHFQSAILLHAWTQHSPLTQLCCELKTCPHRTLTRFHRCKDLLLDTLSIYLSATCRSTWKESLLWSWTSNIHRQAHNSFWSPHIRTLCVKLSLHSPLSKPWKAAEVKATADPFLPRLLHAETDNSAHKTVPRDGCDRWQWNF